MVTFRKAPKGALFAVLFLAMLILSLAGTLFLYVQSAQSRAKDRNANLVAAAKAIASASNQADFNALVKPTQSSSQTYSDQQKALDQFRHAFPTINRITTYRLSENKLYAVNSSGDNDTASKFLEPVDEDYPDLRNILKNGAPATASEPSQDRWGTFRSGQAPILNSNGQVIGAVKVDQGEEPMDILLEGFNNLRVALAFSIACSAALAWLLTNYLRRDADIQAIDRRRRDRKLFAEIVLVLLVSLLLIDGGSGVFARHKIATEQSYVTSQLNALSKLDRWIHDNNSVQFDTLQDSLSNLGFTQLADSTKELLALKISKESLANAASRESQASLKRLAQLDLDAQANNGNQARNILIATLVCAVALVIVRYATSKDEQVIEYQAASLKSQRQYQDVVENLPVGLFTFKEGHYQFANREWSAQFNPDYDEDITDAWLEAVHPEDRESVKDVIESAERDRHPFAVQYRVVTNSGAILHLESRGVPLFESDGTFNNLLGFTVDLSPTVNAKNALQVAYGEVEKRNKLLNSALTELEESLGSMVRSFVKAVEAKDPYTAGHSERVMQYSVWLGEAIGLGAYELRVLELGTLVHDVGKIGIPDAILTKPGRLTPEEFDIIKKHPEWGEQIIHHIGLFKECLPIVRSHHERLDGRGYPDGLKGDEISILVRISSIADIFDAMTSTRAYRQGMDVDTVLQQMYDIAERGEIDAHLFAVFCQIIKERGIIPQTIIPESRLAA